MSFEKFVEVFNDIQDLEDLLKFETDPVFIKKYETERNSLRLILDSIKFGDEEKIKADNVMCLEEDTCQSCGS